MEGENRVLYICVFVCTYLYFLLDFCLYKKQLRLQTPAVFRIVSVVVVVIVIVKYFSLADWKQ